MTLILFVMNMPMPPSWIFYFVLGPSLPVAQFSQQGRQDNLCWVPLSVFQFSRDGSHPFPPGMPQQTWSTVCSVEVWDGIALAMGHMLDAACCSCTRFPQSSQTLISVTQPAHGELHRVGRAVCAPPQQPLRAQSLLLGTHLQHTGAAGALGAASLHRAPQREMQCDVRC